MKTILEDIICKFTQAVTVMGKVWEGFSLNLQHRQPSYNIDNLGFSGGTGA